ncbi:MAG: serine/threonine protein kinase [Candidatus Accumulibacter regalis]|jgi:RIO kinase 1|uniref:non-specific serine/threonine protein kinase n=2 Tax=Candidatus Accumulibacter TaxID=327159 RepID=A0A011Q9Y7_ACCRE|nr:MULTISPECIES: PA4780 family RIO1-like protein kinase [unclassified Candidatus Accumulibacter]EXI85935.1 MAG: serine/threonine protein kinase [Candidatus Accumulibacter regalis]MQM34755.1 serine protein kinase RIO [Candidatus Accumulibacter phosphatis]MBL8368223.1 serine protein kinase RIO [Accumulibacter sp.]MBN8513367.1 serine protein kinase RIO [Accumulibacter sp.]MBO3701266.1 serine protein kinase RIO [Accumulibacter sp.]
MKTPARLATLVEEGLVDEVLGQLMSGKEATVYVVRCGEDIRCAKVYKEASQRSFRHNASYQEGRKVRNSRQARAMEKGSRFGRKMQEEVWQSAEVDALYRLAAAGVRVPQPHLCYEGVLLMDLIVDANGDAAPRLNDVELSDELALEFHALLINQVVRMLCAGIIHGDLSEYNILVGEDGPVIIDVPQAIDAAGNSNAAEMFARDVINLRTYFSAFAPSLADTQFGKEIWAHYESGSLTPDLALTGYVVADERLADVDAVLQQVDLAIKENEIRRMCKEDQ